MPKHRMDLAHGKLVLGRHLFSTCQFFSKGESSFRVLRFLRTVSKHSMGAEEVTPKMGSPMLWAKSLIFSFNASPRPLHPL